MAAIFKKYRRKLGLYIKKYFESLQGSFIKLGQIMAARPDFFSFEFCEAMSGLLDEVKPFKYKLGIQIIEKELKQPVTKLFKEISPVPVSAASFAQVYTAIGHDGKKLAIKIMRPGISYRVYCDIILLRLVIIFTSFFRFTRRFGIKYVFNEFISMITDELDYSHEIRALKVSWLNSKKIKYLNVPEVIENYSTKKIITMEFIEGISMRELLSKIRNGNEKITLPSGEGIDTVLVSRRLFQVFNDQIFRYGYFHADPHAGNIFVMENNEIGIVDFGITSWIDKEYQDLLIEYTVCLLNNEYNKAIDLSMKMFFTYDKNMDDKEMKDSLKKSVICWMAKVKDPNVDYIHKSSTKFIFENIGVAQKYNFMLNNNLMRFFRSLFIIETMYLELNPEFDFLELQKSYFKGLIIDRYKDTVKLPNGFNLLLQSYNYMNKFNQTVDMVHHYFDVLKSDSFNIKKKVNRLELLFAEFFYLLGFVVLITRIFYGKVNYGALLNLDINIDFKIPLALFIFIGYRISRNSNIN